MLWFVECTCKDALSQVINSKAYFPSPVNPLGGARLQVAPEFWVSPSTTPQPWLSLSKTSRTWTECDTQEEWDFLDLLALRRPPSAWTLHPAAARLAASDAETAKKKRPKGVPLQFDINSVGKPVSYKVEEPTYDWVTGLWEAKIHRMSWHVALYFPSFQKQTSMTLNERFRILKEGRAQKSKGNRFVVVD